MELVLLKIVICSAGRPYFQTQAGTNTFSDDTASLRKEISLHLGDGIIAMPYGSMNSASVPFWGVSL
jgi:hypothetical protein